MARDEARVPPGSVPAADRRLNVHVPASLGAIGKKWTMVILRDVAFLPRASFGEIRNRNPPLTRRVLSLRLRSLTVGGLVERVYDDVDRRRVCYRLTSQGVAILPLLNAAVDYFSQITEASNNRPASAHASAGVFYTLSEGRGSDSVN